MGLESAGSVTHSPRVEAPRCRIEIPADKQRQQRDDDSRNESAHVSPLTCYLFRRRESNILLRVALLSSSAIALPPAPHPQPWAGTPLPAAARKAPAYRLRRCAQSAHPESQSTPR